MSRVSQWHAPTFVPADVVFSERLVVFALDSSSQYAILQSRVHEIWAKFFGYTQEDRPVYATEDCFETYPFPDRAESEPALEHTGSRYFDFRAALMIRNDEGLTKTYNRFHDPEERNADILMLRELHDSMDRAVLDAYGWTDIRPTCEFILDYEKEDDDTPGRASKKKKPWRYRWPDDVRDEVLGRLLELNAQRAREEQLARAAAAATQAKGQTGRKKATKKTPARSGGVTPLLDDTVASDDER